MKQLQPLALECKLLGDENINKETKEVNRNSCMADEAQNFYTSNILIVAVLPKQDLRLTNTIVWKIQRQQILQKEYSLVKNLGVSKFERNLYYISRDQSRAQKLVARVFADSLN